MESTTPEAKVDIMFLRETIFFLPQVLMQKAEMTHGDVIDYVS
jgi:hypothetical protein